MIVIAHRGLLNGPNETLENTPEQINYAIESGFDVEIDLWSINDKLFLGHDKPQYEVDHDWLLHRENYLWIHCKNIDALLKMERSYFNYFWHENDTVTLTSKAIIWAYPGKQPIKNSIAVLPELNDDMISDCLGVCTDYSIKYREMTK